MVDMVIVLGLAAFAARALPRLSRPHALASDNYYHLYCARVIRANRFRVPHRLPQVMLGHEYTYPFLYHYLLALLPCGLRLKLERVSSALFDAAAVAAVGWFSLWLLETAAWDLDPRAPLLTAALFAFSPALLRMGSGPRAYSGNPRPLGQLFYLLHLLSAYHAFATGSLSSLVASVLCGAVLFAGSKFSVQVLLFFAPFFAIFVTPWYLALPLLSAATAVLLTGGKAWRVLVGHCRHSDFYVRVLQQIFLHPGAASPGKYARALAGHLGGALRRRAWRPALDWYFLERYPLHLLLTVYTPFLVLPFLADRMGSGSGPERFLLAWAIAAFVCFLATQTRPLRFLGEAERYLENAMFPALLLSVDFLLGVHPAWVYGFLLYSVFAAFHYALAFRAQNGASETSHAEAEQAFASLHRMPPGAVLPIGSLHWFTLYHTRFPVLTIGGNIDENLLPRDEFRLVLGRYPYPSAEFDRILDAYDVRYIVSDRPQVRHYAEHILGAPEAFYGRVKALFDSPALVVYQVVRPGAA
jgi:hypothetical protein